MTYWLALLFGAVQGLTEFLPVSSSGHLAVLSMLTMENSDLFFIIILHIGTFAAVCAAYHRDIAALIKALFSFIPGLVKNPSEEHRKMLLMLIVSLLPLFLVLPAKGVLEAALGSPWAIGAALCLTAALLLFADRFNKGQKSVADMTVRDALIIGAVQALAVMPGLSRSGATLAAALFCGMDRENAVKYSFVLSLPTILGAAVLEFSDAFRAGVDPGLAGPYLVGALAAGVTGFAAIGLVRLISKKKKLWIFSAYTAALGLGLILSRLV